jgi:hypothetical protein
MANISDASVWIRAKGCREELENYIKVAQKGAEYNIVYPGVGGELDIGEDVGMIKIDGSATGRWVYTCNTRCYFPKPDDLVTLRSWVGEKSEKEVATAYQVLLKAIRDNKGFVRLEYGDTEPSMLECNEGYIEIRYDEDTQDLTHKEDVKSYDYNAENYNKVHRISGAFDCAKCNGVSFEMDTCAGCGDKICENCELYVCRDCPKTYCWDCGEGDGSGVNQCGGECISIKDNEEKGNNEKNN